MKITVIGWYGTETIGDRAILAGLISFFNQSFNSFELKLGSLYPFFSDRTFNEDYSFYKEIIDHNDIKIELFNSKSSRQLCKAIKESDLIVMGGGPLMDLNELFMVEYAFKQAKKLNKTTAILGCGIGPLFHKKFRKSVFEITKYSDKIILRDTSSKEILKSIYHEFNYKFVSSNIFCSFDPAVECILQFSKLKTQSRKDYIAINLREFPLEYFNTSSPSNINCKLGSFVGELAKKNLNREIKLIPMHYFHIGGDDRIFLNDIAQDLGFENITVQNKNLTLKETIDIYQDAYFNIGMRFHSIVFQTLVSGYNYILDYTEPKKGKTSGFITDIDKSSFYSNRYIALQEEGINISLIKNETDHFIFNQANIKSHLNIYSQTLKKISQ